MRARPLPTLALTRALALLLTLCAALPTWASPHPAPGELHALRRAAGWEPLFEGDSLDGWRAQGVVGEQGWTIRDGVLHLAAGGHGGDLLSERSFADFELEFEWKVAPGANSGVKYRVAPGAPSLGPEYQVLDNRRHANGADPLTSAAALYALYPSPHGDRDDDLGGAGDPRASRSRPGFRRGRIVARGSRLEHWIDGRRVFVAEVGSDDWRARLAASKFAALSDLATQSGPLLLQDHDDEVWYRNLFVRDLDALPGMPVVLDAGPELRGWRALGDARYVGEGDTILGEVDGGGQSFLITEREFGDFLLEVDVRPELPGNSGIQVRSRLHPDTGRLFGYQIEIDSSPRAWSGGLYDEGRRGWLDDLADNPAGRAAFRPGEWNRYRIECVGPSLRAWVDGVPTADFLDGATLGGVLGLQVHSGADTRVRWRDLRLRDLGRHEWRSLLDDELLARAADGDWQRAPEGGLTAQHESRLLRWTSAQPQGSLRLVVQSSHPEASLSWFAEGGGPPAGSLPPGLTCKSGGWYLQLNDTEPHELEWHATGRRRALLVDGRVLLDTSVSFGGTLRLLQVDPGEDLATERPTTRRMFSATPGVTLHALDELRRVR